MILGKKKKIWGAIEGIPGEGNVMIKNFASAPTLRWHWGPHWRKAISGEMATENSMGVLHVYSDSTLSPSCVSITMTWVISLDWMSSVSSLQMKVAEE